MSNNSTTMSTTSCGKEKMVNFSPASPAIPDPSVFFTKVLRLRRLAAALRAGVGGPGVQSEPPLGSVHRGGCLDDRSLYLIINGRVMQ